MNIEFDGHSAANEAHASERRVDELRSRCVVLESQLDSLQHANQALKAERDSLSSNLQAALVDRQNANDAAADAEQRAHQAQVQLRFTLYLW
jgi:chromosome segregation ATPase